MKLSIIMPVFNEDSFIEETINRCLQARIPSIFTEREIIIVDDGSTDNTHGILEKFKKKYPNKVIIHKLEVNAGKSYALRSGFTRASGNIYLVQDADLEYCPKENYYNLLLPFEEDTETMVVYGSRFLINKWPKGMKLKNLAANYLFAIIVRLLYRAPITDEATCYKVFKKEVLNDINLISMRFEFCPEFTSKILKKKIKIKEVPITYNGRSVLEGKKIKFKDGLVCIWVLIINFFSKN